MEYDSMPPKRRLDALLELCPDNHASDELFRRLCAETEQHLARQPQRDTLAVRTVPSSVRAA